MTKEVAILKLRKAQSNLIMSEIVLEMHENGVRDLREDIENLEAIINKKIEEKKPLLITEDGVEIFEGDRFIMVGDDFIKHKRTAFNLPYTEDYKKFKHESNADEYILWNKPLLSLQEIDSVIKGSLPEFDELKKLAEKRVKQ